MESVQEITMVWYLCGHSGDCPRYQDGHSCNEPANEPSGSRCGRRRACNSTGVAGQVAVRYCTSADQVHWGPLEQSRAKTLNPMHCIEVNS